MNILTTKQTDLYKLYQFFNDHDDERRKNQILNLIEKQKDRRFIICFSGHFSAGKSSLINELMQDSLLPTSPIPTSANVVRLSYGEPKIDIRFHDGRHATFTPPFDEHSIWQLCKNGEDVREVHIQTDQGINDRLEWMDTPGIDSTDPLHMAITEDAVMLSDHIFYVMDYNHVQASENYKFLESIRGLGKPFHLVVSQMDKHRESEIPFIKYKQSILDSLQAWGLKPESIHFVSIKNKSIENNEWNDFQHYLMSLTTQHTEESDIDPILKKLATDHENWWNDQYYEQEEQIKEACQSGLDQSEIDEKLKHIENEKHELEMKRQQWSENTLKAGEKAIQSAILMPYETRELAKKYIESCQTNFKVGFLSSKSKIENERRHRLEQFCESLDQLLITMMRQVSESLVSSLNEQIGLSDDVQQQLFSLAIKADPNHIASLIQRGAIATGTYVLNFTNTVESDLKNKTKKQVRAMIEELSPSINSQLDTELQTFDHEFNKYNEILRAHEAFSEFEAFKNEHFQTLDLIINGDVVLTEKEHQQLLDEIKAEDQVIDGQSLLIDTSEENTKNSVAKSIDADHPETEYQTDENKIDWIQLFNEAANTLNALNGFKHIAEKLLRRVDRLQNKRFTIALFGAFSAGKSSFANALMGQSVLPVSPHPTTATINRILPIDQNHDHETVVITFKDDSAVLDEVNQALESFHQHIDQLDDLGDLLTSLPRLSDSRHLVFLEAVVNGYAAIRERLGQTKQFKLDQALAYISEEQKACFVDTADIYYDCELTRHGIVLVDTPGADSINARHTDTAFRFIRNADALVYVTYYNHAFSKADQEFLIQLGRVKDTFELDKMFFVINAIDLAHSPEEIEDVKGYVRNRLTEFGIRQARLYGVSSLNELNKKSESPDSGFSHFYKDWQTYVDIGLQKQSIDQGFRDIAKADVLLVDLIKKMALSEDEKLAAREQAKTAYATAIDTIKQSQVTIYSKRIVNEIEELFFYVKKRVMQRFIDEFSGFFNPSVLTSQATESKKILLKRCLDECVQFLSFDIDQETRATFLRSEAMLRRLIKEFRDQKTKELDRDWAIDLSEEVTWTSPSINVSLKNVDTTPFEASFKHYKNPKQFFEGDGKSVLRDALFDLLSVAIDRVLLDNREVTKQHYLEEFEKAVNDDQEHYTAELTHIFDQRMSVLEQNAEESITLQETSHHLKQLVSTI